MKINMESITIYMYKFTVLVGEGNNEYRTFVCIVLSFGRTSSLGFSLFYWKLIFSRLSILVHILLRKVCLVSIINSFSSVLLVHFIVKMIVSCTRL